MIKTKASKPTAVTPDPGMGRVEMEASDDEA